MLSMVIGLVIGGCALRRRSETMHFPAACVFVYNISPMSRHSLPSCAFLLLLQLVLLLARLPCARAEPLRVDQSAERLRVDGAIREWKGARFTSLGSGPDAGLRFALATGEGDGLYLAADITDERLVRRNGVGTRQDALILTLAMPTSAGGLRAVEIYLHAGETGKSKAQAGIASFGDAPRVTTDVKVVEGPREGGAGYVIEAFIPFRLAPGAEIWEQGRASLRFEDVDSEASTRVETVLNTQTAAKPSELPRIALGAGQKDLLGSFMAAQHLVAVEPGFDLRGQVAGDRAPERVVIVDKFVVVYGPHYKQGTGFSSMVLPFGMGGGIKAAELVDVTGDGIEELTCILRQRNELGAREVWQAISFADENPRVIFGIEIRKEAQGGFIESTLALEKKSRGAAIIRVQTGRSSGFSAENYRETRAAEVEPILLPWAEVVSRTYQFDGVKLAVIDEKLDPKKRAVATQAKSSPVRSDQLAEAAPLAPMAPIAPTVEAVLALFKEQRGIPKDARPSRQLRANLVGSRAPEDVFAFGAQLVIVGPDLGEGGSYFAYGLPIADAADLLHLGAADVTGDGKAELFVRVRQSLSGVEGVKRGVMLVHRFDEQQRFSRVLSVEAFRYAFRSEGRAHISNRVSIERGKLTVSPGHATGWSETSYPFVDEAVAGVGKLLLPWKDKPVRYHWSAGALSPE